MELMYLRSGILAIAFAVIVKDSFALRHTSRNSTQALVAKNNATAGGFENFYYTHDQGRGIWKWSNAVHAYQRHFSPWYGYNVKVGEVGVQSGGSIDMWKAAMGSSCFIYGFDINPECKQFNDPSTVIVMGDQADPAMWQKFFSEQTPNLDILVDDGGHEPHQMLTTLYQVWPHLSPGGFISIEDIHGQHYAESFFTPAGHFLGQQGNVDSVHVYPFLLIAQRAGQSNTLPKIGLTIPAVSAHVTSFEQMWPAIQQSPGGAVLLENSGWGSFTTPQGLANFFTYFKDLHTSEWYDVPEGCEHTSAATCTNIIRNSPMQNLITGVHIYPSQLIVEVAHSPILQAVRKGTQWIAYR